MNLNHLTDTELISYILKHDTDPVRVRLAGIMDRMPGRIIDGLERAGMDPETCLHENTYESGEYIEHLNNEIEYLNRELQETQEKLAERETLTVSELIAELHRDTDNAHRKVAEANRQLHEAEREREEMRSKLKMWTTLSADAKELR